MVAFNKLKRNKWGIAALTVVAIYLLMAIVIEVYGIYCDSLNIIPIYSITDDVAKYAPPSVKHFLGTDYQGRDVLFRAIAGCATAVKVGIISASIASVIGVVLGLIAGYKGGKFDDVIVWIYSTFASMPTLLFILAFALLVSRDFLSPNILSVVKTISGCLRLEPGMLAVYVAIGVTGWISLCRVVRSETMKLKNVAFVEAAKIAGVNELVILFRHILPNVFHLVIIYFTLNFAGAVMLEVIVSFLGFGVQSAPSWGVMISDGQTRLWRGIWWELTAASSFMFVLILALNILGDALRDALDPKA